MQTGTALHETDETWDFAIAANRDLIAIKKSNTRSNSTEVNVLSASQNYQHFTLQTGTALHETDETWDFAIAANRDLVAIKKSNTRSNFTEVNVLSASQNYQHFTLQTRTALHETDETWDFAIAANRDLIAIKKSNTRSNSTEVNVLSASQHYQHFTLQTGTALHETDETWDFAIAANRDLVAIKRVGTKTRSTEVHVLAAENGYRRFALQTGTVLHTTPQGFAFDVTRHGDLLAIKQWDTGTGSTEVHMIDVSYSKPFPFNLRNRTVSQFRPPGG